MNQEDVVLLLEKCFEEAAAGVREQAGFASKLLEPDIAKVLGDMADSLEGVDVAFHVCMLQVYKEEEADNGGV